MAGGLHARFEGGELYWSKATGSRLLTGRVADAYRAAGGPAGRLGFPTTDAATAGTRTVAGFANGQIGCPTSGTCQVSYDD